MFQTHKVVVLAKVIVDACHSVPHMPIDVQALGVNFLVASSHMVYSYLLYMVDKMLCAIYKIFIIALSGMILQ
jgi:hypothetical protein